MEMETVSLGSWLRERCQREGLSLRQASIKIGISHTTIADLLNGTRASPRTIKKLAQAFGRGGDKHRMALEDELLVIVGHRTQRPKSQELSEPLAQLLDTASRLTERQTRLLTYIAEFFDKTDR